MPRSKKSKITLLWNNLFGGFIGLYLGFLASFKITIPLLILLIVILLFIIRRFGVAASLLFLIAFLLGYLSVLIPVRPPASINGNYLVLDAESNYVIAQRGLVRYYVYCSNNQYQFGDILQIDGSVAELHFYHIEGQFDFEHYLVHRGVNQGINTIKITPIFKFPGRISIFKERFLHQYDDNTKIYLAALIFNHRDYEAGVIQRLDNLNLIHLLNGSGLLTHFVLGLINNVMRRFVSEEKARRYSFVVLLPWLLLVPTSVVLWRLVIGGTINVFTFRNSSNPPSYWTRKGLLGIIMLLVSKYLVYNPGFYLSFGLSSILYLTKKTTQMSAWWRRLAVHYLPTIILLPYLVISYHSLNLMGLILLIPLVYIHGLILALGLLQVFTISMPLIIKPLVRLSILILDGGRLFTLELNFRPWSWIEVTIYLLFILIIFYLSTWPHRRLTGKLAASLAIFLIIQILPISALYQTAVYFINVGQGDAILIQNRTQAVLVDTGGSLYIDVAEIALIPFFKSHGIDKIDTVIITHDDYDHTGALNSLTAMYRVDEIITKADAFPLVRAGIGFSNLNRLHHQADENDNSLVLLFHFDDADWLLMGDGSIQVESQIIIDYPKLKVDYLKIGHHGSNTSTSLEFLKHVQPQEAIVSVGRNYYGHPASDVLDRLSFLGIIIRRTDVEGTIAYV